MRTKTLFCLSCLLMLGWGRPTLGELVGHWALNEGTGGNGAPVADSSGMGNDGKIVNNPTWVPGVFGKALEFHGKGASGGGGDHIDCGTGASLNIPSNISIALWIRPSADDPEGEGTETAPMAKALDPGWSWQVRYGWGSNQPYMAFTFNTSPRAWVYVGQKLNRDEWCHIACAHDGTTLRCYLNGAQTGETPMGQIAGSSTPVLIGSDGWGCDWMGAIDDVRIYNHGLTAEELKEIIAAGGVELAREPVPEKGATDVLSSTPVSWTAGQLAATHDVYFGTAFDDVNGASRDDPRGVLVSQDQVDASYDPDGLLEYGTTYYWRIDEVNAAPDNTIFKGQVWSFTVEPYAYPILSVTPKASSTQPGMSVQNIVNGSGLNDLDQHSTEATDMWTTTGAKPHWIEFEFDKTYKLHELWVWNSNQLVESMIGMGARNVRIEHSIDGQTWTPLGDVTEFARADGMPTYTANTKVAFGGVMAKFVRLNLDSNWGGMVAQTGLSEVRFFHVPLQAFKPEPAQDATGVSLDAALTWRAGREASSHKVYVGADSAAVANGAVPSQSVSECAFSPTDLMLGTKYFWRVDEIGAAGTYAGDVWSFTTEQFAAVDDFESYTDDIDAETTIWHAWIDGMTDGKSGSQVGYTDAPFAERTIVHGGRQSMPLQYGNPGFAFSEATRTFDPTQDWTARGATKLAIHFAGAVDNTGQLYAKVNGAKIAYDGDAANLANAAWQVWTIDLSKVGNVKQVSALTIGVEGSGAKGTLYIDDIQLQP